MYKLQKNAKYQIPKKVICYKTLNFHIDVLDMRYKGQIFYFNPKNTISHLYAQHQPKVK